MNNQQMTPGQFKKLSPAEKRVEIAKDVIAQLKAKKYVADVGSYIILDETQDNNKSLQKQLPDMQCEVCALGGCLLSLVKFENTLLAGEVGASTGQWSEKAHKMLQDLFNNEQIMLIESAFEVSDSNYGNYILENMLDSDSEQAAMDFGDEYLDNGDRLEAIMLNIIENKGEFIP